jgi:thiosulfate reductase cytochrome b subunit
VTVRVTHWITFACAVALLVTGIEILISHPRFYWGETGTVMDEPLFSIPIPSSRATVPTGYDYVLPDQNGWSRSLHFQSGWLLVLTGLFYVGAGMGSGHFRDHLVPAARDLSLRGALAQHDAWSYNGVQRLTYLFVIFVLFPLMIWTGLAMSDGVAAGYPVMVTSLGGRQSARTLHFAATVLVSLFAIVHVVMVIRAGLVSRVGAMITGRPGGEEQ